jgi:hypothetical protein
MPTQWPFRDFDEFWLWTGRNSDQIKFFLGIPSILIAVAIFLFNYHDKELAERRKTSLDYIQRYVQGDVLGARIKLQQAFIGKDFDDFTAQVLYEHPPPVTNQDKVRFLVEKQKLLEQIIVLAEYFEHVTLCVNSDLCYLQTVCEVLYTDMKLFANDYLSYVDNIRTTQQRPAGQLRGFATRYSSAKDCHARSSWSSYMWSFVGK